MNTFMPPWTPFHPSHLEEVRALAAQLLEIALREFLPGTLNLDCRTTHEGFIVDCFSKEPLTAAHLEALEVYVRTLAQQAQPIRCTEMQGRVAGELMRHYDEPYLAKQADRQAKGLVDVSYIGERPVLGKLTASSTAQLRGIKLLSVHPLQERTFRIEGTAMPTTSDLRRHLKALSKAPDHESLGKEFFRYQPHIGKESWYWLPKGTIVRHELLKWWWETQTTLGFEAVSTPNFPPHAGYEENHRQLCAMEWHSYKRLPLRLAEVGPARYEAQDHLHGLFKASSITTDLTTIFCTQQQLQPLLTSSLQYLSNSVNMLRFESRLPTHKADLSFGFQLILKDRLGREWWGPRAEVVELSGRYQDADGSVTKGCTVHLSFFGALERCIAVMLEHFDGHLPLWLSPEQVRVIPLAERHIGAAEELQKQLKEIGVRASVEQRSDRLEGKVRAAQLGHVPYTVVVGDAERSLQTLAVRTRSDSAVRRVAKEIWFENLREEILSRSASR